MTAPDCEWDRILQLVALLNLKLHGYMSGSAEHAKKYMKALVHPKNAIHLEKRDQVASNMRARQLAHWKESAKCGRLLHIYESHGSHERRTIIFLLELKVQRSSLENPSTTLPRSASDGCELRFLFHDFGFTVQCPFQKPKLLSRCKHRVRGHRCLFNPSCK